MRKAFFCLLFVSSFSGAEIQYRPISSVEKHELSSGFGFSIKKWRESFKNKFFLNYVFYFPELSRFYFPDLNRIFIPGLQAGVNFFKTQKNYGICPSRKDIYSSAYHTGLKGKSAYFEWGQPFVGIGLLKTFCYAKNFSKNFSPKSRLSYYISYGLLLSLKILDRSSIYAMDQDYGINDLGVKLECLHNYYKDKKNKPFYFCQLGLQISF